VKIFLALTCAIHPSDRRDIFLYGVFSSQVSSILPTRTVGILYHSDAIAGSFSNRDLARLFLPDNSSGYSQSATSLFAWSCSRPFLRKQHVVVARG